MGWTLQEEDAGEGTYELCEVMYDTSAKCNKNLPAEADYEVSSEHGHGLLKSIDK